MRIRIQETQNYGMFYEFIMAGVRRYFYRYRIPCCQFIDDDYHYRYSVRYANSEMASLALWPFGKTVRSGERSGGCLYILMNVLWIFLGGIWICLSHLAFGVVLCITIIGIPFGLQHFKLAGLALTPFGKDIISD